MAETVISPAAFHEAGLAVDIRNDEWENFNHISSGVHGFETVLQSEEPAANGTFSWVHEAYAARPSAAKSSRRPTGGIPKRCFDVITALAALVLLAPFLLLIAALVKASMGGPVLYRHRRIGFNGIPFDCLKFRTMHTCSDRVFHDYLDRNPSAAEEWRRKRKLDNDPRVTELGHLLRKTSLDELPQLINVLRGEMSLVGPRPVVREELERYGASAGYYMRARPGVTGLWQVSGRSSLSFDQRIELDTTYVREWALAKDIHIMAQTLPAILKTPHTA